MIKHVKPFIGRFLKIIFLMCYTIMKKKKKLYRMPFLKKCIGNWFCFPKNTRERRFSVIYFIFEARMASNDVTSEIILGAFLYL